MMRRLVEVALAILVLVTVAAAAPDQGKPVKIKVPPLPPSTEDTLYADPAQASWVPGEKFGLPKGAQIALIGQDPTNTGATVYLKVPAGWKMPAHWHTHTEYLTVIAGKASFTVDGKPHALGPGSYAVTPGKRRHELTCEAGADCLLIVRRSGPTDLTWVNPPK